MTPAKPHYPPPTDQRPGLDMTARDLFRLGVVVAAFWAGLVALLLLAVG